MSPLLNLTLFDHLVDGGASLVGHESQDREDDKAGEHRGAAVQERDDAGVTVTVVVELVEAGHRHDGSPGGTHTVEDLHGSLTPHLEIREQGLDECQEFTFGPVIVIWTTDPGMTAYYIYHEYAELHR